MNKLLTQNLQIPWGADNGKAIIKGNLDIPSKTGTLMLGDILSVAIKYIFVFAGIGLLLMLLSSGFSFLTSAGDSKKLEKAKGTMTNAIIGFVIIFAAFWVVQIAGVMFGLNTSWTFIGN